MSDQTAGPAMEPGPELRGDCANCFALCCVAPGFSASADFAVDKPAGVPCVHQRPDFRCDIHSTLADRGFTGCTVYDCFGAGQQVAQVTFGGRDWRRHPGTAELMFQVFAVMRDLHEQLWYLTRARALAPTHPIHGALDETAARIRWQAAGSAAEVLRVDVPASCREVDALLARAGDLVRSAVLDALGTAPGKPHSEYRLQQATGLPTASLRPILARLERAGQITRTATSRYTLTTPA